MHNDFPEGLINVTAHRPWALPQSPWLMTQSWHNLLFAHWPVDADLLRVDGFWKSKNYTQAAELIEVIYSQGEGSNELDQVGRMNVVKAAVGFVLANDTMGVSRLRAKFGDAMAQSAEWAIFNFVTSDITPTSAEFKKVARQVADLDSLNAFLTSYRQVYPGDPMTPVEAVPPPNAA